MAFGSPIGEHESKRVRHELVWVPILKLRRHCVSDSAIYHQLSLQLNCFRLSDYSDVISSSVSDLRRVNLKINWKF